MRQGETARKADLQKIKFDDQMIDVFMKFENIKSKGMALEQITKSYE